MPCKAASPMQAPNMPPPWGLAPPGAKGVGPQCGGACAPHGVHLGAKPRVYTHLFKLEKVEK